MKIRIGFVSNSSSSSFTALCTAVSLDEIDVSKYPYFCVGKELFDGTDIFYIDETNIKFFKLFGNDYPFDFYQGKDSDRIKKEDLDDGVEYEIINQWADYNSSSDIKELINRYTEIDIDDIEDVDEYINKLFREKKLKRIV